MMSQPEKLVIRITGDSGDGIQLLGEQLTLIAASSGQDVQTLPDFPAEIRAPIGTVAGVSGFQLAMSESEIFTAGDALDVLVALNPAALKHSLSYLNPQGILIVNQDSMQDKDWQKAGATPSLMDKASSDYQVISLPLIQYTQEAVADLDLSQTQAKKTKNCYVLGLVLWLFEFKPELSLEFLAQKFKAEPNLCQANQQALMAGYNYGMTLELARRPKLIQGTSRGAGVYRQITGVEAIGLAAASLAVETKLPILVAGYPITPSSAILQECAQLSDFGVHMFQAEDEISAICACIGAAYSGSLALCCTSGPGLDLKSESLGLAVISELPLVIIDVQRAGASTGLPTKTGQSDLNQALFGRHGEAPLPILAPQSPSDCFHVLLEAFHIATRYMTPVIILMDAYLAMAAQSWQLPKLEHLNFPKIQFNRFPKPFKRDDYLSRSWNIPGTPGFIYQLGGLEKQGETGAVSYDADNHQQMVDLRAKKIAGIAAEYPPLTLEGQPNAEILLIGWGSTYGSLKSILPLCESEGISIALLQLKHINPLPTELPQILQRFKWVIMAELNSGQLCQILRARYLKDIRSLNQCNGQAFSSKQLFCRIQELIHELKNIQP